MKRKIIYVVLIVAIIFSYIYIPNVSKAAKEDIVIILDPGHGGRDPGAQNYDIGLKEADVNLKIARYLNEYLSEYDGIKVIMTHNGIDSEDYLQLVDRGMIARNNNANILISLHINDATIKELYGAEVFVTANTSCKKYNEESTELANNILNELIKLGLHSRGVKTRLSDEPGDKYMYSDGTIADYYGVIRYPMKGEGDGIGVDIAAGEGIPGIIVEHCFINNENDVKYINSDENIKKLAKADCDAIVKHYGLRTKKEVEEEKAKEREKELKIETDKDELYLLNGEEIKLNVASIEDKKILFKAEDNKIVSIDDVGNIKALDVGKTNIIITAENTKISKKIPVMVSKLAENQKIEIKNLKEENSILTKITEKTSKKDFLKNFVISDNLKIDVKNCEEYINSNTIIEISDKEKDVIYKKYYCIVFGDINNDGKITASDYVLIKNHIMETNKLMFNAIISADVNRDSKITASDYVLIKNHIMNGTELKIE